MNKTEKYINTLKEDVEQCMGRKLYGHGDFKELSEIIYQKKKEMISTTTLKRMWGYLKKETNTPQVRTLNVLSSFIEYKDWQDYCNYQENKNNNYSSEFVKHNTQHCFLMKNGAKIRISWYPSRCIVLKHEGDGDLFTVLSSENSKLEPGMTLHCETFTAKEALTLKNVKGGSLSESCDYICGKIGGIEYEIVEK